MRGKNVFSAVSLIGSLPAYVLLLVCSYLFGSDWFFLSLLIMLALTTAVVYCIKWWFPTERPKKRSLPARKRPWNHWRFVDQSSFPSAHAAYAAGLSVLVLVWYAWWWALAAFLFVAVVGWSRLKLEKHHGRDVIAGVALGFLIGVLAWRSLPLFIPWL